MHFANAEGHRGLRVYPYPRVYPTLPVPAGTGRGVYMLHGYGLGRVDALRVRVYPFLPVKNNKMCIATLHVVVKVRHKICVYLFIEAKYDNCLCSVDNVSVSAQLVWFCISKLGVF